MMSCRKIRLRLTSFPIFCALIVCVSFVAHAGPVQSRDSLSLLNTPVYEKYPIVSNSIFNQSVTQALRWTTIGALGGAAVGLVYDLQQEEIFIPASFIFGLVGAGAGCLAGIPVGVFTGLDLQRQKRLNSSVHAPRYKFGYEVTIVSLSEQFLHRTVARYNDFPGIALTFRPFSSHTAVPEKISIGYYGEVWGRASDYTVPDYGRMFISRLEGMFRYDFITTDFIVPFWSVGLGYAWGRETRSTGIPAEKKLNSPVVRGYAGCELNLFDFVNADLRLGYEAVGPYLVTGHKGDYPYTQNIQVGFSVGTYVF